MAAGATHDEYAADFTTRDKDWHYADAKMNVTVQKKAPPLSWKPRPRLTGTVTVQESGRYIMHEGVQYDQEYIEWREAGIHRRYQGLLRPQGRCEAGEGCHAFLATRQQSWPP